MLEKKNIKIKGSINEKEEIFIEVIKESLCEFIMKCNKDELNDIIENGFDIEIKGDNPKNE